MGTDQDQEEVKFTVATSTNPSSHIGQAGVLLGISRKIFPPAASSPAWIQHRLRLCCKFFKKIIHSYFHPDSKTPLKKGYW